MDKKRRVLIRISALFLCVTVIMINTVCYMSADTLSEAEAQKKELESKRDELKDSLSDLENEKSDIIKYIEKIDKKMNKVSADMKALQKKIKKNKASIAELESQISVSENDIQNQYETMKKRIKYMYEKGNTDYLDILLSSESISDLLSRSSYIEKISEYDSDMLNTFVSKKNELEVEKTSLITKREALNYSKETLDIEKKALATISDKKTGELEKYDSQIKNAENQIDKNESELDRQEQLIADALLEQQRKIAEEEERKAKEERDRKAAEKLRKEEEAKKKAQEEAAKSTPLPQGVTAAPVATAEPDDSDDAPSTEANTSGFTWPLPIAGKITSSFGNRTSPTAGASSYHQGIDISAASGTAILAAQAGTVVTASYSSGAGNYIMINHGGGVFTVYMHASSLAVSVNQKVSKGQTIAYVGSTGISTGAHLHFGVSVGGSYVNPQNYVSW